jgi:hypothetical protein
MQCSSTDNKTALVIATAVPLTYNLPKTEEENIRKYENMALVIKSIWKFNNVSIYRLAISAEGKVTRNFLTYPENIGVSENI